MSLIEIYFRVNRSQAVYPVLRGFFGKPSVFRYEGSPFLRDFFGNAPGFRYDSAPVSSGIVRKRPKKTRVFPEETTKPPRSAREALPKKSRRKPGQNPKPSRRENGLRLKRGGSPVHPCIGQGARAGQKIFS
ncbi:MAG TPA: hypothetical protein VG890_06115 [Puia sp.]|nr:hypothetical protein [Puia sp.]